MSLTSDKARRTAEHCVGGDLRCSGGLPGAATLFGERKRRTSAEAGVGSDGVHPALLSSGCKRNRIRSELLCLFQPQVWPHD